jgi:WD40 repeat protein
VKLWSTANGKELATLAENKFPVMHVRFSPDGKRVASLCGEDKAIKLWDLATAKESVVLTGHTKFVRQIEFSPDGRRLASASDDGTVKPWSVASGK